MIFLFFSIRYITPLHPLAAWLPCCLIWPWVIGDLLGECTEQQQQQEKKHPKKRPSICIYVQVATMTDRRTIAAAVASSSSPSQCISLLMTTTHDLTITIISRDKGADMLALCMCWSSSSPTYGCCRSRCMAASVICIQLNWIGLAVTVVTADQRSVPSSCRNVFADRCFYLFCWHLSTASPSPPAPPPPCSRSSVKWLTENDSGSRSVIWSR